MKRVVVVLVLLASSWLRAAPIGGAKTETLEQLVARIPEVCRNGIGSQNPEWVALYQKIRSVGPKAVPLLREHLKDKDPNIHLFAAITLGHILGPNSGNEETAPIVAEILRRPDAVDDRVWSAIDSIRDRYRFGEATTPVVSSLLEVAEDTSVAVENRVIALKAMCAFGEVSDSFVPRLRALTELGSNEITTSAETAITHTQTEASVEILTRRLQAVPRLEALCNIAQKGAIARSASDDVLRLFSDPHWESRVAAARALGFVGDESCINPLRELLKNDEDWRLAFVAAESLGRLKAKSAKRDVESIAQDHWFPPVRDAAKKALRVLAGEERYVAPQDIRNFGFEFFNHQWPWGDEEPQSIELSGELIEAEPSALTEAERRGETFTTELYGEVGFNCGLRIEEGMLLGSDRGEWGGELVFTDRGGRDFVIVGDNVSGIHRMPFGVVAATGLAHVTMNHGYLYLIDVDAKPIPTAQIWKALPGAPRKTGRLANGGLFISCVGGDVVISPEGKIAMATEETVGLK